MQFSKIILALGFTAAAAAIAVPAPAPEAAPVEHQAIARSAKIGARKVYTLEDLVKRACKRDPEDAETDNDADAFYITGC